jgi:hypothetical protein
VRIAKNVHWTIALLTLLIFCAGALGIFSPKPAAAQSRDEKVIYLDQAWSQTDREMFYQTTQGASTGSYDIFLNLEVAGSQELFQSDANSERYGLIPQAANPRTNPDALPVGLAKNVITEGRWKGETVGPNCAACHTTQLNYKGKKIRIDGGTGNLLDIQGYIRAFDDPLQATLADPAKFDRLDSERRVQTPRAHCASAMRAMPSEYMSIAPAPWSPP